MIKKYFAGALIGFVISLMIAALASIIFDARVHVPDIESADRQQNPDTAETKPEASPFKPGFITAPEQPKDNITAVAEAGMDLPLQPEVGDTKAISPSPPTPSDSLPPVNEAEEAQITTQSEQEILPAQEETPDQQVAELEAVEEEQEKPQVEAITNLPPLMAYSIGFENPEDKPLLAIILMDEGVNLERVAVGLPALGSFPAPVTFAVDARLSDAAQRMKIYRESGFEVLAMLDVAQDANAADAQAILEAALSSMPQVVGVLEGVETGIQVEDETSRHLMQLLKNSGHGIVLQNNGLNSLAEAFSEHGVPTATVFRDFDSEDQTAIVIRRFLDQAAFRARQEGAVIMLGRLRSETVSALLLWGLQDRASRVAIAPVSTVLER